jgi:hypothetical protein
MYAPDLIELSEDDGHARSSGHPLDAAQLEEREWQSKHAPNAVRLD